MWLTVRTDAAAPNAEAPSGADPAAADALPDHLSVRGPIIASPAVVLGARSSWALITLLGIAALVQVVPGAERLRLFGERPADATPAEAVPTPVLVEGEATLEAETRARPELAQPEEVALPGQRSGPLARAGTVQELQVDVTKPPVPLIDAEHRALAGFYRSLAATARREPQAITRIVHFGDSIVTSDYVSGTLRRKFQKAFGDAGHGYMLLANAWPAYFHNDVERFASSGWLVSRIVGPLAPDGLYGLGGVSFRAPPGSRARFGTAKQGSFGRNVSRFELVYLEEPGGGKARINVDGVEHSVLDTSGPIKRVTTKVIEVPDGPHELELVTLSGYTRAFGVVMERAEPGVTYDAIGVQGARIRFLDKQDDEHWAAQLAWRKPALLVYQFGANESGDGFAYPMDEYYTSMKAVLAQGKRAVPEAGCLVVGAMDRAEKRGTALQTMAVIPAIVKEQQRAAADTGCAFFDTYAAMGGFGSMAAWVERGLGQADLTHPTGSGSEVLASWLFGALMQGYEDYRVAGSGQSP